MSPEVWRAGIGPRLYQALADRVHGVRRPSLEGAVRSGLLLQLASAWEKRQAYALALAVEANDSTKQRLGYSPQDHP